ncbi:hypothetical protein E0Z10_g7225 [Xylaria hypoxylon]|uniref:AMP-dependent synthetase/ligase domain-containing protein n=1 Tax=Xylaria hypoxylon TaxID=37992 RepID=A0A4Z0YBD2_9PEZI|nr:hypothetical protein E0Z10_g7225 [Xylaria hypoxylon]
MTMKLTPVELWRHPDPHSTPMFAFLNHVRNKYQLDINDYPGLWDWSTKNPSDFWEQVWHFCGIRVLPPDAPIFPRPDFFAGALLNFAENLLFPENVDVNESSTAVITVTEVTAIFGQQAGLNCERRDVVAGFVSNHVESLVAMLGAVAVGAIWTGISPDNGVSAVLDRLVQVEPKVLFADNGTIYNGKPWSSMDKAAQIVNELKTLQLVVLIKNIPEAQLQLQHLKSRDSVAVTEYENFLSSSSAHEPLRFEQLPPAHPLYVLYSSGTTGLPKAIVHTAQGTLIQHKKEHMLHCSMDSTSRLLYYTTTSWMMWHWSVSALASMMLNLDISTNMFLFEACGSTIVLYSGSPFKPHGYLSLPRLLSSLNVTHFGTSATYLTTLEANRIYPSASLDLSHLQAIYSTASPLPPSTFSFVYKAFPSHINLGSITGGTDIISLFGAPCSILPVYAGEIQCCGLGMAVDVVDSISGERTPGEDGELVCTKPFPCQPLTFWGPNGEDKYRASYFERFANVWHHGDFVRINACTGGLTMLGRSDGVLKPSGVRFGSAEIYNVLTKFFGGEVKDAVCVGRRRETDRDETVCLFVVMCEGHEFTDELCFKIQRTIRTELSPRHVPAVIEKAGNGIPRTDNGKKIEVAVKQILSGVKTNASVANPESLAWFQTWAANHN